MESIKISNLSVKNVLESGDYFVVDSPAGTFKITGSMLKEYMGLSSSMEEIKGLIPKIVNDLTTGGVDKGLSAEQGKAISLIYDPIEKEFFEARTGYDGTKYNSLKERLDEEREKMLSGVTEKTMKVNTDITRTSHTHTVEGVTKNMRLKGRTFHNLLQGVNSYDKVACTRNFYISKNNNPDVGRIFYYNDLVDANKQPHSKIIPGKKYTFTCRINKVYDETPTDTSSSKSFLRFYCINGDGVGADYQTVINKPNAIEGRRIFTTVQFESAVVRRIGLYMEGSHYDAGREIEIMDPMLFEGELTQEEKDNLPLFTGWGVQSAGGYEGDIIRLFSHNENLLDYRRPVGVPNADNTGNATELNNKFENDYMKVRRHSWGYNPNTDIIHGIYGERYEILYDYEPIGPGFSADSKPRFCYFPYAYSRYAINMYKNTVGGFNIVNQDYFGGLLVSQQTALPPNSYGKFWNIRLVHQADKNRPYTPALDTRKSLSGSPSGGLKRLKNPNGEDIYDEIVMENGIMKVIQRVGYIKITRDMNIGVWKNTNTSAPEYNPDNIAKYCGFFIPDVDGLPDSWSSPNHYKLFSNRFIVDDSVYYWMKGNAAISDGSRKLYFTIDRSIINSDGSDDVSALKNWLTDNEIFFYYELTTPIVTEYPLTNCELKTYPWRTDIGCENLIEPFMTYEIPVDSNSQVASLYQMVSDANNISSNNNMEVSQKQLQTNENILTNAIQSLSDRINNYK